MNGETSAEERGETTTGAKPRSGCLRWLARGAAVIVVLAFGLAIAGLIYQAVASAEDARAFPPPGERVDIGGRALHLNCTGEAAAGRPTVILETLSGGFSSYWAWVQEDIEQTTRVCSYDRAGRGWSDPDPDIRTLQRTVADLHALLQAAGETGPFVLAGHSIGGLYVRRYAAEHPEEVVGLVLVDSSHPEQFERHPELLAQGQSFRRILVFFPALARLGLFHLYFAAGGEIDFQDLPARAHDETAAFLSSPGHWTSNLQELDGSEAIFEDAQQLGDLGDLPLAVVTAGTANPPGWQEMQAELAQLSTNSKQVIVDDAIHASLAFNEAHAEATSSAILEVVEAAFTGGRLAPPEE